MAISIESFRMPRYSEIPDMGLYLDQTIKYINRQLAPLGSMEITSSMVSNYVKKGYIENPVKKQYSAEQIAYLLFIAIAKSVLSMDNIALMIQLQKAAYSSEVAYDYFCDETENTFRFLFGLQPELKILGQSNTELKSMLRSVIVAVANVIYVNDKLENPAPVLEELERMNEKGTV